MGAGKRLAWGRIEPHDTAFVTEARMLMHPISLAVALALAGAAHAATNTTPPSTAPNATFSTGANGTTTITMTGNAAAPGDFVIGANGERTPVSPVANALPAQAAATPTPELDAATRAAAARERAKVARKQQLMHSITPRTNVDRTDQMPDDPIIPR
jgi:hypothetical protein